MIQFEVYIKYDSGIIFDIIHNLEWLVGPDRDINLNDANAWINNLNINSNGWRIPTDNEVATLLEKYEISKFFMTTGRYVWIMDKVGEKPYACVMLLQTRYKNILVVDEQDTFYNRVFAVRHLQQAK